MGPACRKGWDFLQSTEASYDLPQSPFPCSLGLGPCTWAQLCPEETGHRQSLRLTEFYFPTGPTLWAVSLVCPG